MLRNHFGSRVVGRQHTDASGLFFLCYQWPFPFDPIEEHCRKDTVSFAIEHLRGVRVQERGLAAVRKNIRPAGERIAKGCAASSVHNIGGNNAEMQRRRHLKKHLELINLRTILRRGDVKFDEAFYGLLAGLPTDAQVCWLAARRTYSTGLYAKLVQPAVLWTGFTKPVR